MKLATPTALANAFSSVIREWFTPEELAEINERNAEYERQARDCCATHEFSDSNMALLEAWETLHGEDTMDLQNDQHIALCNEAWSMAKRAQFQPIGE